MVLMARKSPILTSWHSTPTMAKMSSPQFRGFNKKERSISDRLYVGTNVQMYKCTNVQMYKCTNVHKCRKNPSKPNAEKQGKNAKNKSSSL